MEPTRHQPNQKFPASTPLAARPSNGSDKSVSDFSSLLPVPGTSVFHHYASALNLPTIFKYGLYLSTDRPTVFPGEKAPPVCWGWLDERVAIAVRMPSARMGEISGVLGLNLSNPEPVKFPAELAAHLASYDALWEPPDDRKATTKKPKHLFVAVNGAHNLLKAQAAGTLRHFPLSTFDIGLMRKANTYGPFATLAHRYIDALQRSNFEGVNESIAPPPALTRIHDLIRYKIESFRSRQEDRRRLSDSDLDSEDDPLF